MMTNTMAKSLILNKIILSSRKFQTKVRQKLKIFQLQKVFNKPQEKQRKITKVKII